MNLADKLITLRKKQNWTQASAARIIDIQQSYLSKLENGRHAPSQEVLVKLCKAYKISSKDLLSTQTKIPKYTVILLLMTAMSLSLVLSGYLALFYPETYYTYQAVQVKSTQKQSPLLKIQLTDQYLGDRYVTNINKHEFEYELIAQRKISRIENRWLIAIGAIASLFIFGMIYYNWHHNNKPTTSFD